MVGKTCILPEPYECWQSLRFYPCPEGSSVMVDSIKFGFDKRGIELEERKLMIFYIPTHLHIPNEIAEASGIWGAVRRDILLCTQPEERQYKPPVNVTDIANCIAQPAAEGNIRRSVYVAAQSVQPPPGERVADSDDGFSSMCGPDGGVLVENVDIKMVRFGQYVGQIKLMIIVASFSPGFQG